ncbi:MAG: HupE/UreJ family protein [Gammaproteobacteria bacterium]|nr:HupE/UreJ family protein [Gammaproteobacteria bacterium]
MKHLSIPHILHFFRQLTRSQALIPLLSLSLWISPGPSQADIVKPALIEISIFSKGTYQVEVRASIEAIMSGIDARYKNTQDSPNAEAYDKLRAMQADELLSAFEAFKPRLYNEVYLKFDGQKTPLNISSVKIPEPGYLKVPRTSVIMLEGSISKDVESVIWYFPQAFADNAVRLRQADENNEKWHWSNWQWLRKDQPSEAFSLTEVFNPPSLMDTIQTYTGAGFDHILPKGLDHILFILGIFLLSLKMRPLLWQVTMFTLAHSITLSLSMLDIISLPSSIVEPLIALSIAYIAIENIFAKDNNEKARNSRLAIVFAFGLLHGLGFATMLADFGMPDDAFTTALISFNIGVELGQLFVVGVAFLAVGIWFGQKTWYRQAVIIPASAMIAITGLYWTYDRIVF